MSRVEEGGQDVNRRERGDRCRGRTMKSPSRYWTCPCPLPNKPSSLAYLVALLLGVGQSASVFLSIPLASVLHQELPVFEFPQAIHALISRLLLLYLPIYKSSSTYSTCKLLILNPVIFTPANLVISLLGLPVPYPVSRHFIPGFRPII